MFVENENFSDKIDNISNSFLDAVNLNASNYNKSLISMLSFTVEMNKNYNKRLTDLEEAFLSLSSNNNDDKCTDNIKLNIFQRKEEDIISSILNQINKRLQLIDINGTQININEKILDETSITNKLFANRISAINPLEESPKKSKMLKIYNDNNTFNDDNIILNNNTKEDETKSLNVNTNNSNKNNENRFNNSTYIKTNRNMSLINVNRHNKSDIDINNNLKAKDQYVYKALSDLQDKNETNLSKVNNLEDNLTKLDNEICNYDFKINKYVDEFKVLNNNFIEFKEKTSKNIEEYCSTIKSLEDKLENICLKLSNYDLYNLASNSIDNNNNDNVQNSNNDSLTLLIRNVEKIANNKFVYLENKINENISSITTLKNVSLINDKDNNSTINDLKKLITQFQYTKEDMLNNLEQKTIDNQININNIKHFLDKLNINKDSNTFLSSSKNDNKFEENLHTNNHNLEEKSNIKTELKSDKFNLDLIEEDIIKIKQSYKISISLQKKFDKFLQEYNNQCVIEKIENINNKINNKTDINETKDLKEIQQNMNSQIEYIKGEIAILNENNKVIDDFNILNRKVDNLYIHFNNYKKIQTSSNKNEFTYNPIDTSRFIDYSTIDNLKSKFKNDFKELEDYIVALKRKLEECGFNLLKKASNADLKSLENLILTKIEENKLMFFKKFADKLETKKYLKYLDIQLNGINEGINNKHEKRDNWLLAKKPLNNYMCASCEAYIGDIKESNEGKDINIKKKYNFNNLFNEEKIYRCAAGYSKLLNCLGDDDNVFNNSQVSFNKTHNEFPNNLNKSTLNFGTNKNSIDNKTKINNENVKYNANIKPNYKKITDNNSISALNEPICSINKLRKKIINNKKINNYPKPTNDSNDNKNKFNKIEINNNNNISFPSIVNIYKLKK